MKKILPVLLIVASLFCGTALTACKKVRRPYSGEDSAVMPKIESYADMSFVKAENLPPDNSDAAKALATELYNAANENFQKIQACAYIVNCVNDMTALIIPMKVAGFRFVLKNGEEYYYAEYSIPEGAGGQLAAKFEKENTAFATRSYVDLAKMNYLYSEKSYSPKFKEGTSEIQCDWSDKNRVGDKKWPVEQEVPPFCDSQDKPYTQTDQVINEKTIKSAKIEYFKTDAGNYYSITADLDVENPDTTAISIVNLRKGAGSDARYVKMTETIEIWENGYYKRFRSVDGWEAGVMKSELDYDTYFYYDENHTTPGTYRNFDEVKTNALAYNEKKN